MSTLLLIPWIIFRFKHPTQRFLGLPQTKKSLLTLLIIEVVFFSALIHFLDKPDPNVAGQGSFAWNYYLYYEKGIIPCFGIAEWINGTLGDKIDRDYNYLYLITALIMDYLILKLISPAIWGFKTTARN